MGIPGILREIGKGERIALSKLAVEHLKRTRRPLRIAIDAAIWNFQAQSGQGGKNPALRTLYYKLLKLLALPIHPVFVYDGKNKPLVKRGRTVTRWGTNVANEASKRLVSHFQFPHHTAPGEAEAECALLQRQGIVDMVMSQDGDAIMFGSAITLRDWSKEGTKGNKTPTHVNLLDLPRIKERVGLDPDGMILVALLSGGDYDQNGLAGFGAGLACEIARAGFGADLLQVLRHNDETGLEEWRERLQFELETNESGYFKTKHKSLRIPQTFPDRTIVEYYVNPAVSGPEQLQNLEIKLQQIWDSDINVPEFRKYVGETFDWLYKPGAWKFVRGMAPALLANKLRKAMAARFVRTVDQIAERRQHFINDGIPELRVSAIPNSIVELDLDAEEDSPVYLAKMAEEQDADETAEGQETYSAQIEDQDIFSSSQPTIRGRRTPPWNPFVPEKMWIAETIVELGVPALVEQWHKNQQEALSNPLKFATRKCKPKASSNSKVKIVKETGAIKQYLVVSKATNPLSQLQQKAFHLNSERSEDVSDYPTSPPRTPQKHVNTEIAKTPSRDISHFFGRTRMTTRTHDESASSLPVPCNSENSLHLAGSSASDVITIQSSPNTADREKVVVLGPSTPNRPHYQISEDTAENADIPKLPSSVTQRRKRSSRRTRNDKSQVVVVADTAKLKPISSFFSAATGNKGNARHHDQISREVETFDLPTEPSTGLQTEFSPKRVHAFTRESLPGTWKHFDSEEDIRPNTSRRQPRVSYVDMTVD